MFMPPRNATNFLVILSVTFLGDSTEICSAFGVFQNPNVIAADKVVIEFMSPMLLPKWYQKTVDDFDKSVMSVCGQLCCLIT